MCLEPNIENVNATRYSLKQVYAGPIIPDNRGDNSNYASDRLWP